MTRSLENAWLRGNAVLRAARTRNLAPWLLSSLPPKAAAHVPPLIVRREIEPHVRRPCLVVHVDYWDDLGWRDRFPWPSRLRGRTLRSKNLRRSSVYTPQLVVDDADDMSVRNGRAVRQP